MLSNSSASRNRRKGPRRFLKLKIVIDGTDAFGERFNEQTETRVVTKDGGLFTTGRRLRIGQTIRVSTPDAKFSAEYDSKVEKESRTRLPSSLEPQAPSPGATEKNPNARPPQPTATAPPQEAKPERAPQQGGPGALAMRTPGERQKTEKGQENGETEVNEDGTFQKEGDNAGDPRSGGTRNTASLVRASRWRAQTCTCASRNLETWTDGALVPRTRRGPRSMAMPTLPKRTLPGRW